MKRVYVKDYVTLPCDDAAVGIAKAAEDAKKLCADEIVFEKGEYNLVNSAVTNMPFVTLKDGTVKSTGKVTSHIIFEDFENIRIVGATDENGEPATVLVGYNHCQQNTELPSVLFVKGGKNITVENFKITRSTPFSTTARVTKIAGGTVTLEVLEGCPCYDNMGTYCMNRFTPDGDLNGESLSYGNGLGISLEKVGENTVRFTDEKTAERIAVGDIITFHQGAKTEFQCFFGYIDGLNIKNIRTVTSNGFAAKAMMVNNLRTEKFVVKPEGNMRFVAPRDAFKLRQCTGDIVMDKMYIEGVRMDGQNMHSEFLKILGIVNENTLHIFMPERFDEPKMGTDLEIYFGTKKVLRKINKLYNIEPVITEEQRRGYEFDLELESLPDGISTDNLCIFAGLEPDSYKCTNSTFKNVAGAGHLSRIDNLEIANCTYSHMMNSGILLGCEYGYWKEGGHTENAYIHDCTFDSCGNTPRYKAYGCIGIKSHGLPAPHNKHIKIERCKFKNSDIGIDIHDAYDVTVKDCEFSGVKENVKIEEETTEDIKVL